MKRKKDNIEKLQENVEELGLDIQALTEEQDWYYLADGLPIKTLYDSIVFDRKILRKRGSLRDIHHKIALEKIKNKKIDELEIKKHKLNAARIGLILEKINRELG
jgi:hypothetical protein